VNIASQSRQLNLHWLDRPQSWIDKLDSLVPQEAKQAWRWHVSHHQLLTLAKRSEREVGLSILWFAVTRENETLMLGAVLPGDRIAIVPPATHALRPAFDREEGQELHDFLKARLRIKSVMGRESELKNFGFLFDRVQDDILERQTPWGKRLTNIADSDSKLLRSSLNLTRRALETDRPMLTRWARIFAADTRAEAHQTTIEAFEWMRRGKLLIFETDRPIGMAALSGEYSDPDFGRSCRLSLIYVDPVYRGRGYGHEMVNAIENEVRLENANALVLYSDPENARAFRFYSSLGFTPADDWFEVALPDDPGFNVNTTG
jgi:GNAT superfamily N-acetyltransferase